MCDTQYFVPQIISFFRVYHLYHLPLSSVHKYSPEIFLLRMQDGGECELKSFTPEQLLAMLFVNLKGTGTIFVSMRMYTRTVNLFSFVHACLCMRLYVLVSWWSGPGFVGYTGCCRTCWVCCV